MKSRHLIVLLAGMVLLGACKGKNYEPGRSSSADTALVQNDSSANATKLVKTADIHFKVKDVQQTSENIAALTIKYNGMVMHHDMSSSTEQTHDIHLTNDSIMRVSAFNTTADMTIRIPSEKIEEFLNTISHMSTHVSVRRMDIEDKSLDYLSTQLKLNNRRELVAQQKTGKVIIKNPTAVLNLKDDLADEQLDNKRIDAAVKYSTISLSFYQSNTISKEIIADDDPSDYHLTFFNETRTAFANGWYLLRETLIIAIDMWAFIVLGGMAWVAVRFYNKKKAPLRPL